MRNPRFAQPLSVCAARADRRGAAGHRQRLLDGLAGRVVEVGAGDGRNLPTTRRRLPRSSRSSRRRPYGLCGGRRPRSRCAGHGDRRASREPALCGRRAGRRGREPRPLQRPRPGARAVRAAARAARRRRSVFPRARDRAPAAEAGALSASPIGVACGRRSPGVVTSRATPAPASTAAGFAVERLTGSSSRPRRSGRSRHPGARATSSTSPERESQARGKWLAGAVRAGLPYRQPDTGPHPAPPPPLASCSASLDPCPTGPATGSPARNPPANSESRH